MAEELVKAVISIGPDAGDVIDTALDVIGRAKTPTLPGGAGWKTYIDDFRYDGVAWRGDIYFQATGLLPIHYAVYKGAEMPPKTVAEGMIDPYTVSDPIAIALKDRNTPFRIHGKAELGVYVPFRAGAGLPYVFPPIPLNSAEDAYWAALIRNAMTNCSAAASRFRDELSLYKSAMSDWEGTKGNTQTLYNDIKERVKTLKALAQDVKKFYDLAEKARKNIPTIVFPTTISIYVNKVLAMMGVTLPGFTPAAKELDVDKLPDRTRYTKSVRDKAQGLNDKVTQIRGYIRDINIKITTWRKLSPEKRKEQKEKYRNWAIDKADAIRKALREWRDKKQDLAEFGIIPDTTTGYVDMTKIEASADPKTAASASAADAIVSGAVQGHITAVYPTTPEGRAVVAALTGVRVPRMVVLPE